MEADYEGNVSDGKRRALRKATGKGRRADGGGSNKTSAGERGKCVAGGADKGCDAGVFGAVL